MRSTAACRRWSVTASTTGGTGEGLAADLPRGRFEAVEGKRCCFVEHPAAVTDVVEGFLDAVETDG